MLRATSEIAVASSVWSVLVSSSSRRHRARPLAGGDDVGVGLDRDHATRAHPPPSPASFRGRWSSASPSSRSSAVSTSSKLMPELHHRERHLGLDADDHGLGAAQAGHARDPLQRPRDERVHDVERGDVDDDPARPVARDLRHHVVAQLQDVGVGQRRLDRGDQERPLLEDRDGHVLHAATASSAGVSIETL